MNRLTRVLHMDIPFTGMNGRLPWVQLKRYRCGKPYVNTIRGTVVNVVTERLSIASLFSHNDRATYCTAIGSQGKEIALVDSGVPKWSRKT